MPYSSKKIHEVETYVDFLHSVQSQMLASLTMRVRLFVLWLLFTAVGNGWL